MISYTQQDVERLRDLGRKVREIAELPIQQERIALWRNVNDLHMTKPVLYHRDTPPAVLNYNDELTTQIEDPFLASVEADRFSVSVIPHTAEVTLLGRKHAGDTVNLETDIIGKYVEKLLRPREETAPKSGLTLEFLASNGF